MSILPNEMNNFLKKKSKFDSEVNLTLKYLLPIKYSPLSIYKSFNSTTDLSLFITAASEQRFLP